MKYDRPGIRPCTSCGKDIVSTDELEMSDAIKEEIKAAAALAGGSSDDGGE
jgi:hypothetical protein